MYPKSCKWLHRMGILALAFMLMWPAGLTAAEEVQRQKSEDAVNLPLKGYRVENNRSDAYRALADGMSGISLSSSSDGVFPWKKGQGTQSHPYEIYDEKDLIAVRDLYKNQAPNEKIHFKLAKSISLTEPWEPIPRFNGVFDGNGKTISGLRIDAKDLKHAGLFGAIETGGEVRDLILEDVSVKAEATEDLEAHVEIGALAGRNSGTIDNVTVSGGEVHATCRQESYYYDDGIDYYYYYDCSIGGLVGVNNGKIQQSTASTELAGEGHDIRIGGLVGNNKNEVSSSGAGGTVTASTIEDGAETQIIFAGGLVGRSYGTVKDSISRADVNVSGKHINYVNVGGLVGTVEGLLDENYEVISHSTVENTFATGSVNAVATAMVNKDFINISIGGLVGESFGGKIISSAASGAVTGEVKVGDNVKQDDFYYNLMIGGLVAWNTYSEITDSVATGAVGFNIGNIGDNYSAVYAGGLVGFTNGYLTYSNKIVNSIAKGNVEGSSRRLAYVGGLVGENGYFGQIAKSSALGTVKSSGRDVSIGGLVGNNGGDIKDSYAIGDVIGEGDKVNAGGLVGYLRSYNNTSIEKTYVTGDVYVKKNTGDVGGLVGYNANGKINDSYWKEGDLSNACGLNSGTCNATVLSDVYMKMESSYQGWGFGSTWAIDEGESTPYLRQVTLKNVTYPTVDVVAGTAFEDLDLPESVDLWIGHQVREVSADADWQTAGYQPVKVGTQWLKGQLELEGEVEGYAIVGSNVLLAQVNVKPLMAPTNVVATAGNGDVTLTWKVVPEADSYTIYRQDTLTNVIDWVPVKQGITDTTYTVQGLTNGQTYTFAVTARKGDYESELSESVVITSRSSSGGDGSQPAGVNFVIRVETTVDPQTGKTTATVVLDEARLSAHVQSQPGTTVPIHVTQEASQYNIPISGSLIQAMADGRLTLDIQTPAGNYILPLLAMDLAQLAAQLGVDEGLSGVRLQVSIAQGDADTMARMEAAAAQGGFAIVAPLVEFAITATYNGKTVVVNRFNTYIQREIPIPESVDPDSITTAVVMDEQGSVRHVPTIIVERNGRYYAVIRSLTNSAYALISHNKTFADMRGHWAQGVVEDLAARLVVNGVSANAFAPDKPITREQFAALLIRALGLSEHVQVQQAPFRDVPADAWYAGAVAQAQQYGLITGYQDGTFRPGKPITRFEAFVMLSRAMKLVGLEAELPATEAEAILARFADAQEVPGWARPAIAATVQSGLVRGSSGKLLPNKTITRAETAAILHRLLVQSGFIQGE